MSSVSDHRNDAPRIAQLIARCNTHELRDLILHLGVRAEDVERALPYARLRERERRSRAAQDTAAAAEQAARDAYQRGDYAQVDLAVRKADRARKTWARLDEESRHPLPSARCGLPHGGESTVNGTDPGNGRLETG